MTTQTKAKAIVTIEKLRLIESEVFRLLAKHGIASIDEMDIAVKTGKLNETKIGEDFFILDHLLSEKESLEKKLKSLSIKKDRIWKSFQDLLELPKLNFPRL